MMVARQLNDHQRTNNEYTSWLPEKKVKEKIAAHTQTHTRIQYSKKTTHFCR